MDKIDNLKGINRYFCSKCNHFHIRKYKYKIDLDGNKIKTKDTPFFRCENYAVKLTDSKLFKIGISKSFEKYSVKEHKKAYGSRKQ